MVRFLELQKEQTTTLEIFKNIQTRVGLIVGLLAGIINIYVLIYMSEDFDNRFTEMTFIGIACMLSALFLTGVYFRAVKRNLIIGFLSYLKMGLITAAIFTLTYEIGYYSYIKSNEQAFKQAYVTNYIKFLELSQDVTKDHFDDPKHIETKKNMLNTSAFDFIFGDLNIKMLVGVLSSFIIAIILRNTKI